MESTTETTPEAAQVNYAGFGKRMAAHLIDQVMITFFCQPFYWEIHRQVSRYLKRMPKFKSDYGFDSSMYNKADNISNMLFAFMLVFIIWCYYAGMESSPWKGTIGKKLLGLEVTRLDGERAGFLQTTGRHFGKILSGIVLGIGYLVMLGNDRKQTWHDSMSDCVVREK